MTYCSLFVASNEQSFAICLAKRSYWAPILWKGNFALMAAAAPKTVFNHREIAIMMEEKASSRRDANCRYNLNYGGLLQCFVYMTNSVRFTPPQKIRLNSRFSANGVITLFFSFFLIVFSQRLLGWIFRSDLCWRKRFSGRFRYPPIYLWHLWSYVVDSITLGIVAQPLKLLFARKSCEDFTQPWRRKWPMHHRKISIVV